MSYSDETLMAYADGELDAAACRALEQACASDAALARRVAYCKARRTNVFAGFAAGDDRGHARPPRPATVVNLNAVRAKREATQQAARKATRTRRWSWQQWAYLGGLLLVGSAAAHFGMQFLRADDTSIDMIASHDGTLTAQGRLATALEQQASVPPGAAGVATSAAAASAGAVRIAMSFVAEDGSYCRSFASGLGTQELDGLACKTGQDWRVPLVLQNPRPTLSGSGKAASTDLPPQVQAAIEQRISGDPLDAKAEQVAMQRGWQR